MDAIVNDPNAESETPPDTLAPAPATGPSPLGAWTFLVLLMAAVAWVVIMAAVYDPDAWLFPVGGGTAAAIATAVTAPGVAFVWLLGAAAVDAGAGRNMPADATGRPRSVRRRRWGALVIVVLALLGAVMAGAALGGLAVGVVGAKAGSAVGLLTGLALAVRWLGRGA